MDEPTFWYVTSIYGAMTQHGLVEVQLGETKIQVRPSKAREMATMLLEAAAGAEADEILLRVLTGAGLRRQQCGQILVAIRTERAAIDREARKEMRRQIAEDQETTD